MKAIQRKIFNFSVIAGWLCLMLLIADLVIAVALAKNKWFYNESWMNYFIYVTDNITLWTGRVFWMVVILFVIVRGVLEGKLSPLPSSDKIIAGTVCVLRIFRLPKLKISVPGIVILLITGYVLINLFFTPFPYIPPASSILVTQDEKEIYVVNEAAGQVVVIERKPEDGGGLKRKKEIDLNYSNVKVKPQRLAISPDGNFVYVTHPNADEVIIIDRLHNNKVLSRISVGRLPRSIAFTPDGAKAYVSNEGPIPQGSISVIRVLDDKKKYVHQVIKKITGVNCPEGIAIPYNGKKLYVASQAGSNEDPVFVIDTVTDEILKRETIGKMAVGTNVALSPKHHKLYIARGNYFSRDDAKGRVGSPFSIIDTRTRKELRTHTLKTSVDLVVVTPDERYVLVGNGNNITVFDTTTDLELKTFTPREANPIGIAVSEDNSVFVLYSGMKIYTFGLSGLFIN